MPMTQAMDCLAILSRHLPGLARILSGDAPAATVFTRRLTWAVCLLASACAGDVQREWPMPYVSRAGARQGRLDVLASFADGSVLAIEIDRANKRASVHKLQLARQRLPALALWIRWRGVAMAPPADIQLLDLSADGARPDFLERPTMFPTAHALLHALPDARLAEVFDTLAAAGPVRIERIVSHGQVSPEGFWYDQAQAEWVMVVQGAARLAFADGEVALAAGDWLTIPAHCRHRVAWTAPDQDTVWLAVFYDEAGEQHAGR